MTKINNVPKFVEHRIAQRRRVKKMGIDKTDAGNIKVNAFDIARKKYEEKDALKAQREAELAEKEKKIAERKKERKQMGKLFRKKNDYGQPNMKSQLELIMKKFNRN